MSKNSIFSLLLGFAAFTLPFSASTPLRAQETSKAPLPEGQIREAVAKILKKADKAECKSPDCRIAVANFTFSSGLTSRLGMELADQFSRQLASQRNTIHIIDRAQLHSDFELQRIPATLLNNEKAMRWLGKAVGATSILTGTIENSGSSVRVKVRLLSCSKDKRGSEESFTFSYSGPASDLSVKEAFTPQFSSADTSSDPAVRRAGVNGVTQPSCIFCPNPDYTNPAREAKFSGTAVLEAVVSAEGRTMQTWIVRGLPFGLNQASTDAVRSWRFKPATLNGKPVTVKVDIEVSFNLR